jgi:hypothetical protein
VELDGHPLILTIGGLRRQAPGVAGAALARRPAVSGSWRRRGGSRKGAKASRAAQYK